MKVGNNGVAMKKIEATLLKLFERGGNGHSMPV